MAGHSRATLGARISTAERDDDAERRGIAGAGFAALVARATGMSRTRIVRGIEELRSEDPLDAGRTRRAGGGRKRIVDTDPTLVSDLDALLEPITAGEPDDSPLRWTSKSVSKLTAELQALGHPVGHRVVNELLHQLGYTLQANRKSTEGAQHPDRDAQFNYLNEQVRSAQQQGHPVISVDTKKKEFGRRVQERRQGVAGEGRSGAGEGARLRRIHRHRTPGRRRMTKVTARRTNADWAHFLNDFAERYPDAKRVTLVMDNLNIHRPGALYLMK